MEGQISLRHGDRLARVLFGPALLVGLQLRLSKRAECDPLLAERLQLMSQQIKGCTDGVTRPFGSHFPGREFRPQGRQILLHRAQFWAAGCESVWCVAGGVIRQSVTMSPVGPSLASDLPRDRVPDEIGNLLPFIVTKSNRPWIDFVTMKGRR